MKQSIRDYPLLCIIIAFLFGFAMGDLVSYLMY